MIETKQTPDINKTYTAHYKNFKVSKAAFLNNFFKTKFSGIYLLVNLDYQKAFYTTSEYAKEYSINNVASIEMQELLDKISLNESNFLKVSFNNQSETTGVRSEEIADDLSKHHDILINSGYMFKEGLVRIVFESDLYQVHFENFHAKEKQTAIHFTKKDFRNEKLFSGYDDKNLLINQRVNIQEYFENNKFLREKKYIPPSNLKLG